MLKLRRGLVVEVQDAHGPAREQALRVALAGEPAAVRQAIADTGLVGRCEVGDEVVVNVQALDLGLGSGGFDIVHANLTRGLDGDGLPGAHVMKLNYTSLQHAVVPVEGAEMHLPLARPVAVLALHGQLAPVAWAFAQALPGLRVGFVQTEGGALPGGHSYTVAALRERGLLAGHITAGAAFGGEAESLTTAGALHHALRALDWHAAICGPGPGIVGSSSALGHGGMAALDASHVALALGCPTVLVARMSSADQRERHRGISHHTLTVLDLLLAPVIVALPAALDRERPACVTRHDWRRTSVDLPAFAGSGLATRIMGRTLTEDPLFFAAALAGGTVLAEQAAETAAATRRQVASATARERAGD